MIHVAGHDVQVGPLLRQRCAWCGAMLVDVDLRDVGAFDAGDGPSPYPTWPCGALIDHSDGIAFVVDHADGADVPDGCCAKIDPAVTR